MPQINSMEPRYRGSGPSPLIEHSARSPEKRAFTIDEFMAAFAIRRTKTYEEIQTGRLKARKVGGRTIIAREDADAWLAALPAHTPSALAA